LVVVALLAYDVALAQRVDASVLARLVVERDSGRESLATFLTFFGNLPALLVMTALACGIGWARRRPRNAVAALVVVAGANLTTQALKVALSHPRTRELLGAEGVEWDGFPSGHVTAAASIAIAFAFVAPRRLLPAVATLGTCFVVAMGWSVLALNWHYPSDVVGGVLVASSWGFAALASIRFVAVADPSGRVSWAASPPSR
jgi:membrane-associated phospholipid phosphatase